MSKGVFILQGELEFTTETRRYPPDGLPLLTAEIRLPTGSGNRCRAFERYYAAYRRAFFSYCEGDVFPRARAALEAARQTGGALPEWTVTLDTRVTLQREDLVSLCTDTVERTGGRPLVLRRAEAWDLTRCALLTPADLFPAEPHWKRRLLGAAAESFLLHAPAAGARRRRPRGRRRRGCSPRAGRWRSPD